MEPDIPELKSMRLYLANLWIEYDELKEVVERDLATHEIILKIVKDYVDDIIERVFGLDSEELKKKDPSTYYAIIMELVRSEFINVSQYIRSKFYKKYNNRNR